MSENIEQTISEKDLFIGKYFSVKVFTVESEKAGYSQKEIVLHSGSTCLLAITKDGKIIFNKPYRKSIERKSIEIPALKIDTNEDCREKIRKEILEKNKLPYKNLKIIRNFYSSPSYSSERVFLYYVDLEINSAEIDLEDCLCLTFDDVMKMVEKNEIDDSKTIIALQWYALHKDKIEEIL